MTNEENQKDCVRRMGRRLGLIFHRLQAEFQQLLDRWRPFRSLYGSEPKRLEVLNAADANFFAINNQVLWESTLLGIARLVDGHKKAISLARIPALSQGTCNRADLKIKFEKLIEVCRFATVWRNNYIAHRNDQLVLDRQSLKLPAASRAAVEQAFDYIGEYLSSIDVAFGGNPTVWSDYREDFTRPLNLLFTLSDGLRAKESRKKRFEQGTYTQEDITERAKLWERHTD